MVTEQFWKGEEMDLVFVAGRTQTFISYVTTRAQCNSSACQWQHHAFDRYKL